MLKINKKSPFSIFITTIALKLNKICILPTDTVYGFSGKILSTKEKLQKIKGRGDNKPFIYLIGKPEDIFNYTDMTISKKILKLWPGQLTIIVKEKKSDNTIAFRCPEDDWLRKVINKCGFAIYSTSVNRTSENILENISDMEKEFEKEVDLLVDNNKLHGIPSTILDLSGEKPRIVRQGQVHIENIEDLY